VQGVKNVVIFIELIKHYYAQIVVILKMRKPNKFKNDCASSGTDALFVRPF